MKNIIFLLLFAFVLSIDVNADTTYQGTDSAVSFDSVRLYQSLGIKTDTVLRIDTLLKIDTLVRSNLDFIRGDSTLFAPVIFDGDTLYNIYTYIGPYSPDERSRALVDKLMEIAKDPAQEIDSIYVVNESTFSNIFLGDILISTITDIEASILGKSHQLLASERAEILRVAVNDYIERTSFKSILKGIIFSVIATIVLFIILRLFKKYFPIVYSFISEQKGQLIRGIKFQNIEIISDERATRLVINFFRLIRFILTVLLLYFYLPLVLGFFPWTRRFSDQLIGYILEPVKTFLNNLIDYLPDLIFILVAIFITRFIIKFVKFLFKEIDSNNISLPGFYPEWSMPTFKIVRFLIIVATVVVIFPYLPGSSSPAFRGISIFLGLLFSLGSTSAIANIIGGVVITYMRPFKIGDFVKIADTEGNVVEKNLLVTRVRTLKNVDITIPNSIVLSNHIINYSSTSNREGLVLHTKVTIGYDVDWRVVHKLLIDSSKNIDGIMSEPEPFVLQRSLDDFSVTYELNAFTHEASKMPPLYSELHKNIQDNFNKAGVEIMSPIFNAVRDGNRVNIPDDYLPKDYNQPSFRIFPFGGDKK